jgi:dihydroorotate dehydrogenase (fumarate)
MDLTTPYLGFRLPHPFMAGSSPLSKDGDGARRLEEAGSAAIVMPSLFEEGAGDGFGVRSFYADHDLTYRNEAIPWAGALGLSPRDYLQHLGRIKKAVRIPVIASLNGTTPGGWIRYAKLMESEGADALELNLYTLSLEPFDPAEAVERREIELVRALKGNVRIPVAVKLSPFYTSLPQFVRELEGAGADAVVLFNRFYQADLDLESMEVVRTLNLSTSSELLLRLRWLAALHGRVRPPLVVTGGIHTAQDAIKSILCGAQAVQVVSALLNRGPEFLQTLHHDMESWMHDNNHASLDEIRGRMSLLHAPNPKVYERMNYISNLDSWPSPPVPGPSRASGSMPPHRP